MSCNYRPKLLALTATFAAASSVFFSSTPNARAGAGDLFATDPTANTIRVYGLDGTSRIFASGLDSPQGLTFDGAGNLYVADENRGRIYKFTISRSAWPSTGRSSRFPKTAAMQSRASMKTGTYRFFKMSPHLWG